MLHDEEVIEDDLTMADFMSEVDKTMAKIHRGDIRKATVQVVEENGIIASIGYHTDAYLPWREYSNREFDKSEVKIGDEFNVSILRLDDGDGNVLISKKKVENEKSYDDIEKMFKNKEIVTVKLKDVIKGGLTTSIKGVRAFIPGSQITDTYVEDLHSYVGKSIDVQIIEFVPQKRKLIVSGKALAKQRRLEKRQARLDQLQEGEKYIGKITKLMNYGAFVDLDGIEGLIHNSDLSWSRIKHPKDIVQEGQEVEVSIISIDRENGKIALALKDINNDPWENTVANLEEGQLVKGIVTRFALFGAFVRIADGVEGLIHISQISTPRPTKPQDVLTSGQEVEVKIIKIDKAEKRISLSLIAALDEIDPETKKMYMA
ncbi:30S ribosomal protein S1 [Candidatus Epulonipiscium viviparus]|uniref:30S ribosomal protein S1 n=1 Tax=Candidatus Epulonipiscium viviparus TaxID=420336 RepID=UPI000497B412|nr:30S ribosomal protein S1 [Candidatus Epulopiscium viviparus]